MKHKEWDYSPQTSTLTHITGLKILIHHHQANEITEMTPQIPADMEKLKSIQLIRAGVQHFSRNYRLLNQPKKKFDTILSLKR